MDAGKRKALLQELDAAQTEAERDAIVAREFPMIDDAALDAFLAAPSLVELIGPLTSSRAINRILVSVFLKAFAGPEDIRAAKPSPVPRGNPKAAVARENTGSRKRRRVLMTPEQIGQKRQKDEEMRLAFEAQARARAERDEAKDARFARELRLMALRSAKSRPRSKKSARFESLLSRDRAERNSRARGSRNERS